MRSSEIIRASVAFSSVRFTTMSTMPCSCRYSARWNPSGNFSRTVCSITRGPAKPISAPGSAMWMSPSMGKLAVTPPVVGSVSTTMYGSPASFTRRVAITVRGICIRLIAPSCIRAPPDAVKTISGASCSTASLARRKDTFADRRAHRTADELELHRGNDSLLTVDLAVRDHDRIVEMRLVARFLQPFRIALGVTKPQRISDDLWQLDPGEAALVEGEAEPFDRADAHVVATMRTDLQICQQVAMEDHLLAGRTLVP